MTMAKRPSSVEYGQTTSLRKSSSTSSLLIETDDGKDTDAAVKILHVVAPSTMREGYIFWATAGDLSFPIRVPTGGVKVDQTLRVALTDKHCSLPDRGKWKDGLFSCFRFGIFHPHIWNAWLCPQVMLLQILNRMKMSWLLHYNSSGTNPTSATGGSATQSSTKPTVRISIQSLMMVLILFSIYETLMAPPLFQIHVDEKGESQFILSTPSASASPTSSPSSLHVGYLVLCHQILYVVMSIPMTIYGFFVLVRLRAAIRTKYGIPPGILGKMEDFWCVCCCNCCVLSQMARQTVNYDEERAACCSTNGIITKTSSSSSKPGQNHFPKKICSMVNTLTGFAATAAATTSSTGTSATTAADNIDDNDEMVCAKVVAILPPPPLPSTSNIRRSSGSGTATMIKTMPSTSITTSTITSTNTSPPSSTRSTIMAVFQVIKSKH